MANITQLTVRFSGVVAYSDNTTGIFHSGAEGAESDYVLWSVNQAESIENMRQVSWADAANNWPWYRAIILALSSFNFMNVQWDTLLPAVQKDIVSMTGRFDLLVAFDDNTVASAAVTGTGTVNQTTGLLTEMVVVEDEAIAAADNIASVRLGIRTVLHEVMDIVTVTA